MAASDHAIPRDPDEHDDQSSTTTSNAIDLLALVDHGVVTTINPTESGGATAIDTSLSLGSPGSRSHDDPHRNAASARKVRRIPSHPAGNLLVLGSTTTTTTPPPPPPPRSDFLFSKILTSSDVNKLNRLVINKRYAREFFPRLDEAARHPADSKEEVLLFHDHEAKPWPFNYKYWHSSKTYVFSKGWIQYVKRHGLACGDEVSFYREEPSGRLRIRHKKLTSSTNASQF